MQSGRVLQAAQQGSVLCVLDRESSAVRREMTNENRRLHFTDYRAVRSRFASSTARECTTVLDRASSAVRREMTNENRKIYSPTSRSAASARGNAPAHSLPRESNTMQAVRRARALGFQPSDEQNPLYKTGKFTCIVLSGGFCRRVPPADRAPCRTKKNP